MLQLEHFSILGLYPNIHISLILKIDNTKSKFLSVSEIVYNVRLDLLNFIVAFLEEKNTPKKLINMMVIIIKLEMIY